MKDLNNKIFSVWKPSNVISNDIVYKIRERYSLKIGHAGTLDPFAEGVLVLCTGTKTKEVKKIHLFEKKYTAEVKLGSMTDTLDSEGEVILTKKVPIIDARLVKKKIAPFIGKIMQSPPAFSALRKNNIRLYSLARKDILIKLKPRQVEVFSISLKKVGNNYIDIGIDCSKGTYIRSLARDIAAKIGTVGHLSSLKRLSIGDFNKEKCDKFNFLLDESL